MKIEHFAINVEHPREVADWYKEYLDFNMVKQEKEPPYTTFLADDSGRVMIEIYNNPADQVPNYSDMNPLIMHLALVSESPAKDKKRLIEAGAIEVSDEILDDGSHLVMLRDPWGLSLQLCKRSNPMLREKEIY